MSHYEPLFNIICAFEFTTPLPPAAFLPTPLQWLEIHCALNTRLSQSLVTVFCAQLPAFVGISDLVMRKDGDGEFLWGLGSWAAL